MSTRWIAFFLLALPLVSSARTYELTETGPDARIPTEIWKKIEVVEGRDTMTFSLVKVRLVEKTPGVLVDPEVIIQLPRGGGEIDLSKFVRDMQGTFRVFFELEEMTDETKMNAFFVSQARKRRIDGEIWGAGCNKYMDILSFILKDGKTKGIEVNTTRNRHLSVLGGHFFFSMKNQVTQVTFTDSQQSHLFCENPQVK